MDEINQAKEELQEYIKAQIQLTKLHTAGNLSKLLTGIIVNSVLLYIFFFVLLFFSIALAIIIGNEIDSLSIGFIIIGAFYILLMLIFSLFKHRFVETPVIKILIKLFFPSYDEDYGKK